MAKFNKEKNCIELEDTDRIEPWNFNYLESSPIDKVILAMVKKRDELTYRAFEAHGYPREWINSPEAAKHVHVEVIQSRYSSAHKFFVGGELLFIVYTDWRHIEEPESGYKIEYHLDVQHVSMPIKEMLQ